MSLNENFKIGIFSFCLFFDRTIDIYINGQNKTTSVRIFVRTNQRYIPTYRQ